jgi:hypothetical protein
VKAAWRCPQFTIIPCVPGFKYIGTINNAGQHKLFKPEILIYIGKSED